METNSEFVQRLNEQRDRVRTFNLEFNFTKLTPELLAQISDAIDMGKPFGLTNSRGTLNIFHPAKLAHYTSPRGITSATFIYPSAEAFYSGISLALLTCKRFLTEDGLLDLQIKKAIEVFKTGSDDKNK